MGIRWFRFRSRFLKAYDEGWLPPVDGHEIHYYQTGNPKGEPVIQFHGGPGCKAGAKYARVFDLKRQRIISFDQRGCGQTRSKDPFYKNTPQDAIKDAIRLLDFLQVKGKVVASGGSYGATLAILFAETYPKHTKRLCVECVFLGRPKDVENITPVTALFYPDVLDSIQQTAHGKNLTAYYHKLLFSNNRADNEKAMHYYKRFEDICESGEYDISFPHQEITDEDIQKFRVFMHYELNHMFLEPNQLLKDAKKIAHIPTEIFQNRFDFCCPPYQAFDLHKALPGSKLTIVPDKGHGSDYMRYLIYLGNKKRK